jgi:predicted MFS family arabinose efflux permease
VVVGGLSALFNPALQASLPSLVDDRNELHAANALMELTRRLARAIGPSLAGLLAAALPLRHFVTIDAASFLVSALTLYLVAGRLRRGPRARPDPRTRGLYSEVLEALRLTRARPVLWWAFSTLFVVNAAWCAAFLVGAPLLARTLGGGVGAYGLILGAYGAGGVAANFLVGRARVRRPVRWIFGGRLILAFGLIGFAQSPSVILAIVTAALTAVGGPIGDVPMLTLIQLELPEEQLGRVFSLRATLENGGAVLGLWSAAALFRAVPLRLALTACGLAMGACGVAGLWRFRRA